MIHVFTSSVSSLLVFFGAVMPSIVIIFCLICSSSVVADSLLGLPALPFTNHQAPTETQTQLGRLLFNDVRFSTDGSISCASCHQKNKAFTDGQKTPRGIDGKTGFRNAPTVLNAAFYQSFFLDGREESLESQALGPLTNPVEHGLENFDPILKVVKTDPTYIKLFTLTFGIPASQISIQHVAKAIADYERTLISGNSLFDQYYFGRDHSKLSASAERGMRIFRRKGNCANCHEISFKQALFTDNQFYNIGIGYEIIASRLEDLISSVNQHQTIEPLHLTDQQIAELGRFNVTHNIKDLGKFKTPTLRNIALTAPYMHDGSMKTLEEVIEYYDKGGNGQLNPFIDPAIFPLHLTAQEKRDLVSFLNALTSEIIPDP